MKANAPPQVGYHNEHHDFPSVPWTRLPQLRAIAKEFYDPLPAHASWPYVTWKFITDPSVGMWSRAKRTGRGDKIDQAFWSAESTSASTLTPELSATRSVGSISSTSISTVGEAETVDDVRAGMKEAVERGYGSDPE